jgi:Zn-dependent peptidase ImmA (M78 family)
MRRIYRSEGIAIDQQPLGYRIRAAYYCEDNDSSVLLNSKLPKEPKLFTLAHELKHHYLDREQIEKGEIRCGNYNSHELIEKAAEVFAAEFIYPRAEMLELIGAIDITSRTCTAEKVIELKRACPVSVSYAFVVKRLEWFRLCPRDEFKKVHFQKLEEEIYGVPFYKRHSFQQYRARKSASRKSPRS